MRVLLFLPLTTRPKRLDSPPMIDLFPLTTRLLLPKRLNTRSPLGELKEPWMIFLASRIELCVPG